jgi:hypothetical protein
MSEVTFEAELSTTMIFGLTAQNGAINGFDAGGNGFLAAVRWKHN